MWIHTRYRFICTSYLRSNFSILFAIDLNDQLSSYNVQTLNAFRAYAPILENSWFVRRFNGLTKFSNAEVLYCPSIKLNTVNLLATQSKIDGVVDGLMVISLIDGSKNTRINKSPSIHWFIRRITYFDLDWFVQTLNACRVEISWFPSLIRFHEG